HDEAARDDGSRDAQYRRQHGEVAAPRTVGGSRRAAQGKYDGAGRCTARTHHARAHSRVQLGAGSAVSAGSSASPAATRLARFAARWAIGAAAIAARTQKMLERPISAADAVIAPTEQQTANAAAEATPSSPVRGLRKARLAKPPTISKNSARPGTPTVP